LARPVKPQVLVLAREVMLEFQTDAVRSVFTGRHLASMPASGQSGAAPERIAIDAAVAQVFGLTAPQIDSATRGQATAALARQVAMYVTHVSCGMSLTDVGALFSRDRTTVSHACAVIEDRRDDPVFDRVLELLEWIVPELLARGGRGRGLNS
jgi:chromosomal replication initiation ATPase DnaA